MDPQKNDQGATPKKNWPEEDIKLLLACAEAKENEKNDKLKPADFEDISRMYNKKCIVSRSAQQCHKKYLELKIGENFFDKRTMDPQKNDQGATPKKNWPEEDIKLLLACAEAKENEKNDKLKPADFEDISRMYNKKCIVSRSAQQCHKKYLELKRGENFFDKRTMDPQKNDQGATPKKNWPEEDSKLLLACAEAKENENNAKLKPADFEDISRMYNKKCIVSRSAQQCHKKYLELKRGKEKNLNSSLYNGACGSGGSDATQAANHETMQCTKCADSVNKNDKFCSNCGDMLQKCCNCYHILKRVGAPYCNHCGTKQYLTGNLESKLNKKRKYT